MHEAGPASAQLHQGKAGEGEALCLLCAKRQVGLRADLRGGVLSECGGPFPAVPAGSGPFLLMLSPALGFTVTPLLSPLLQSTLAVWVKWPHHPSTPMLAGSKRQFGSVCHQDPR